MAVGLRVYEDAGGAVGPLLVDTTDNILNIVGQTSASTNFSVQNDLFRNGIFWYLYTPLSSWLTTSPTPNAVPSVTYDASTATMSVSGSNFNGVFTYGFK